VVTGGEGSGDGGEERCGAVAVGRERGRERRGKLDLRDLIAR
jgi:hypothetical protein